MSLPPAVTIHGVEQGRAALAPGLPVLLLSGPGAAGYAGAGWWRGLIAQLATGQPDALDCGNEPGRALEALSLGCGILVLEACPAFDGVVARAGGAVVLGVRPASLDMDQRGAARLLLRWLQGDSGATLG